MKKRNLIIALVIAAMGISCNLFANKQANAKTETVQQTEVVETGKEYGEKPIYLTVESLFEQAKSLAEQTVNVQGVIEHVCKHGNNRFKILSTDGSLELKIELGDNFEMVTTDIEGTTAMVTGILTPTQMDAAMVKAWGKRMRENHAGQENTAHYKEELAGIQAIHQQIVSGEIPYYTMYAVQAQDYKIQK